MRKAIAGHSAVSRCRLRSFVLDGLLMAACCGTGIQGLSVARGCRDCFGSDTGLRTATPHRGGAEDAEKTRRIAGFFSLAPKRSSSTSAGSGNEESMASLLIRNGSCSRLHHSRRPCGGQIRPCYKDGALRVLRCLGKLQHESAIHPPLRPRLEATIHRCPRPGARLSAVLTAQRGRRPDECGPG